MSSKNPFRLLSFLPLIPLFFGTLAATPSLTVYNQGFAVVRDALDIKLDKGRNTVSFYGIPNQLEADSVVLLADDPAARFRILEQSLRDDPVSEGLLLHLFEGREIEFERLEGDTRRILKGTILRSGYELGGSNQGQGHHPHALIEMGGQLRFGLPGIPLFPELPDKNALKPFLSWEIESPQAQEFQARLSYLTGGFHWKADYNIVSSPDGTRLSLTGWVTVKNQSGTVYENARLKLMAGDVNKVSPRPRVNKSRVMAMAAQPDGVQGVTEKTFDEYHLYTIAHPSTLRDKETKQIEFIRASEVTASKKYYFKNGHARPGGGVIHHRNYNTGSIDKIQVFRVFQNSKSNGLGMPLPKGRMRFYQKNTDGDLEFIGENNIDHTPEDEEVKLFVGNAFDLVGERKQTHYRHDKARGQIDETFEIRLRNHKESAVTVNVIEYLNRTANWSVEDATHRFEKRDSQRIDFPVEIAAHGEEVLTFLIRYHYEP